MAKKEHKICEVISGKDQRAFKLDLFSRFSNSRTKQFVSSIFFLPLFLPFLFFWCNLHTVKNTNCKCTAQ